MTNLEAIIRELEEERNRIDRAIQALRGIHAGTPHAQTNGSSPAHRKSRRRVSPAARARIAAAQRARWAKFRAEKKK